MTTGTIATLTPERGFGFIQSPSGPRYFFHRSALEPGVEFFDLYVGRHVTFDATDGNGKGPRAENVRLSD